MWSHTLPWRGGLGGGGYFRLAQKYNDSAKSPDLKFINSTGSFRKNEKSKTIVKITVFKQIKFSQLFQVRN